MKKITRNNPLAGAERANEPLNSFDRQTGVGGGNRKSRSWHRGRDSIAWILDEGRPAMLVDRPQSESAVAAHATQNNPEDSLPEDFSR